MSAAINDPPTGEGDGQSWRAWLAPLVSILAFGLVATVLHQVLARHPLHEIVADLRAIPAASLATAAGLTALSYALLTGYDGLALRYLGRRIAPARVALTVLRRLCVRPQPEPRVVHRRRRALPHLLGTGPDDDRRRDGASASAA